MAFSGCDSYRKDTYSDLEYIAIHMSLINLRVG